MANVAQIEVQELTGGVVILIRQAILDGKRARIIKEDDKYTIQVEVGHETGLVMQTWKNISKHFSRRAASIAFEDFLCGKRLATQMRK